MGLRDGFKEEWPVIRQAPRISFVAALGLLFVGSQASSWYYGKRLAEAEGLATRYGQALKLISPDESAMVQLTNEELRRKALRIADDMRAMLATYRKQQLQVRDDFLAKRIDQAGGQKKAAELEQHMADNFTVELRSETHLVMSELRRRLPAEAHRGVARLSPTTEVEIWNLPGVPISAMAINILLRELEDMARNLRD